MAPSQDRMDFEMVRFVNPFSVNISIDANILDEVADGEDESVSEIVCLHERGELVVMLPHSVLNELNNPHTPAHVRRAAEIFLFSERVELNGNERASLTRLLESARGAASPENIDADLLHVWEAAKYGGYFITRDKRLLARAKKLPSDLQLEVVTPSQFVDRLNQARQP